MEGDEWDKEVGVGREREGEEWEGNLLSYQYNNMQH